jgi:hypothetical protein
MKKSSLLKILSAILKTKKKPRKPRKPKIIKSVVPKHTVRQENIINTRPIPVVPDLNRELIREYSEYKKDRFQQPDEQFNKPSEINLYKEFIDYKKLPQDAFNKKVTAKYNELQKVDRQKQYNNLLLEEAKQQQKEDKLLKKEEDRFNTKLTKLKNTIPRQLKAFKGLVPVKITENKIISQQKDYKKDNVIVDEINDFYKENPKLGLPISSDNNAFNYEDNVGLESQFPEIPSEEFIPQVAPAEQVEQRSLIKVGRGGFRVGAGRKKKNNIIIE